VKYIVPLSATLCFTSQKANTIPALGYKKQQDSITLGLLKEPERGKWEPFTCLNSLRDVEPTVNLILDERSLGDDCN
jgi:hypothetical protein